MLTSKHDSFRLSSQSRVKGKKKSANTSNPSVYLLYFIKKLCCIAAFKYYIQLIVFDY